MSIKKAQAIANMLEEELGFSLVSYQNTDLELLKSKLEEFLDTDVETDDLTDPCELASDDAEELPFEDESEEEDC